MVPLGALLLGAALPAKLQLVAPLRGSALLAVVAFMPPASKLGAPFVAARPTLVAASSPLSVEVSAALGLPVALWNAAVLPASVLVGEDLPSALPTRQFSAQPFAGLVTLSTARL